MSRKTSHAGRSTQAVYRIPFDGRPRDLPSKEAVGSKAHNLMLMAQHGLPVPPGFVLSTDLCRAFTEHGAEALDGLDRVLDSELDRLGTHIGRRFGDLKRPLLVSVRSGAPISMPGMMETVLNVGLTADAVQGLLRLTGNPRLANDCRRRLIEQFAAVVHGAPLDPFEKIVAAHLAAHGLQQPHEIDTEGTREIVSAHLAQLEIATGKPLPEDPMRQLLMTIEAVLRSWSSARARTYRRMNHISDEIGTAVIVQAMVFGNSGPLSGSGVGFTRNPADGSPSLYIDYLFYAQGEDVVAGRRNAFGAAELERRLPEAHRDLLRGCKALEGAFGDMQDFEFTVENGRLCFLQTRAGKRTPLAALRIAHDLVADGSITPKAALAQLSQVDLDHIETEELVLPQGVKPIARAVAASVGMISGVAIMDTARLSELGRRGKPLILVREHAETEDIAALERTAALVTRHGARTSHAAVVARQLGKVCLVGCEMLSIDASGRSCRFGDVDVAEGDELSIDGTSGAIYLGDIPVRRQKPEALLATVRSWHRERARNN